MLQLLALKSGNLRHDNEDLILWLHTNYTCSEVVSDLEHIRNTMLLKAKEICQLLIVLAPLMVFTLIYLRYIKSCDCSRIT